MRDNAQLHISIDAWSKTGPTEQMVLRPTQIGDRVMITIGEDAWSVDINALHAAMIALREQKVMSDVDKGNSRVGISELRP